MNKFGAFLFRWRGIIGFIAFVLTWFLAQPNWSSILISLPFIFIGLFFRVWANCYLGQEGRSNKILTKTLITQGPFRFIRNPIYIGNFLLTLGVLTSLHPINYLIILILGLFLIEYSIIIKTEEDFLLKSFGNDYLNYCKTTGKIFPKSLRSRLSTNNNQKYLFKNSLREIQTVVILFIIYGLVYLRMVIKI